MQFREKPVDSTQKTKEKGERSMRRIGTIVVIVTVAIALSVSGREAPAAERGSIRIGYFVPLTGTFSQIGKDMTDGFMLFWDEAGHRVAGRKVEVIVEDTEGV